MNFQKKPAHFCIVQYILYRHNAEILRFSLLIRIIVRLIVSRCLSTLLHPGETRENQMQTPVAKVLVEYESRRRQALGFSMMDGS